MESDGTAAGRDSSTVSRWNPTKEQVNFLEGLYSDGIRTPSPDQIQQITTRLRTYGHIEGKNVFYWFQNHKARDRQKQKQENTMAYNSYLHRYYQPVPAIINPTPNVYCGGGQYYPQPNGDLNFYPQPSTNKLPLPPPSGSSRRKSRGDKPHRDKSRRSSVSYHDAPRYEPARHSIDGASCSGRTQETLSLFPLHPMATLEEESECQSTDYFTLD